MADISDVETALVGLIANSLSLSSSYLAGSAVLSAIAGCNCEIYRGWPVPEHLTKQIASGVATVSVFPVAGSSRRTTRYEPKWNIGAPASPTLTWSVSGSTVTFAGTPSVSQVAGISFGAEVGALAFAYRPIAGDTLPTVASAFAQLIPGSTASGASVTVPSSLNVVADVVADQTAWMETRRQEQDVWIIGWCPSPAVRDTVMKAVDGGFANMMDAYGNLTDQFALPDGSSARLLYRSNHTDDQAQKAGIWRRDLRYVVSYPTTLTQTFTPALFAQGNGVVDGTSASFTFGVIPPNGFNLADPQNSGFIPLT